MDISANWDTYCAMRDEWINEVRAEAKKLGYHPEIDDYELERSQIFADGLHPVAAAAIYVASKNPAPR